MDLNDNVSSLLPAIIVQSATPGLHCHHTHAALANKPMECLYHGTHTTFDTIIVVIIMFIIAELEQT